MTVTFKRNWHGFNEYRDFSTKAGHHNAVPYLQIHLLAPHNGRCQWTVADMHFFCHLMAQQFVHDGHTPTPALAELRRSELGSNVAADASICQLRDQFEYNQDD